MNRSDADASGGAAAVRQLSVIDLCWGQGKVNLMARGLTEKQAGSIIGTVLGMGFPHAEVLAGTEATRDSGTEDPIRYMMGIFRKDRATAKRRQPERSSALTRFADRMGLKHGTSRSRAGDDRQGPVIDHEGDGRPHGALH